MRILLRNLQNRKFSLDIGDFEGLGAMVRELLSPAQLAGDTIDLGPRVNPWDLNVQKAIRQLIVPLVVPPHSTRVITTVPGGYEVKASPPGQLAIQFLEDPDDLVFLFFGGGGSGLTPAQHDALRQLIHFIDEGPGHGFASGATKIVTGGLFPTDITWWDSDPGSNPSAKRLVQKTIERTAGGATLVTPTPVVWTIFDTDGTTILQQLRDDIIYIGVAELERIRTVVV